MKSFLGEMSGTELANFMGFNTKTKPSKSPISESYIHRDLSFFVLQDKLLAGNALEFLGLERELFE